MQTAEILDQLERLRGKLFPKEAVDAAVERREEITPDLLRILDDTANRAEQLKADYAYMAHYYALYLLAQFREPRAYPLVVRLASLPTSVVDGLLDHFLTEGLDSVLASVCGGDLTLIKSLVENEAADQWARGAALDSLVTLVAAGQKSREEIISYFGSLFGGKLKQKPSQVWDSLAVNSCQLYAEELLGDIERAFEEGLIDPSYIAPEYVRHELSSGKERILDRLTDDPHHRLIEDTVDEMQFWSCFRDRQSSSTVHAVPEWTPKIPVPHSSPIRRDSPKIGRNEPCPCGSNKKYKKCCGA
ncbi:MAG TPA: DUF1186 domain-containing protein [Terracidiphilus sp.]|jgi:hypothetical protein